jgi:hypothetical protein
MLTVPSAAGCLPFKWWRSRIALQTGTRLPSSNSSPVPIKSLSVGATNSGGQPEISARFRQMRRPNYEADVPSADYSLCAGRLEIRKPAQRGRFQKLEMRDRHGQFLEATLTV